MRSSIASLLIAVMSLPLVMTAVVMVRFQWERERIINEVCVQRDRPVEQNCCKGSCHLKKELEEQEGPERSPQAPHRIELRAEPAILLQPGVVVPDRSVMERSYGHEMEALVLNGHRSIDEPVPWV